MAARLSRYGFRGVTCEVAFVRRTRLGGLYQPALRCRQFSSNKPELVLNETDSSGITTLTMNNPTKYNGWSRPMMNALYKKLSSAGADPTTKVVILTGAGPYYCAGVDLGSSLSLMPPATLRHALYTMNRDLFLNFLDFPKPIIAAVNGPAIGASVTTATLCDAIVASDKATFNTPFARLGIPPEGCSSVHFEKLMGEETAHRILGPEGWVPTATEAARIGLVTKCVPHDTLLPEAKALAQSWIDDGNIHMRPRSHTGETNTAMLRAVNDAESHAVADAFLSAKFLRAQSAFLSSKGKRGAAAVFSALVFTRPLWSLWL